MLRTGWAWCEAGRGGDIMQHYCAATDQVWDWSGVRVAYCLKLWRVDKQLQNILIEYYFHCGHVNRFIVKFIKPLIIGFYNGFLANKCMPP